MSPQSSTDRAHQLMRAFLNDADCRAASASVTNYPDNHQRLTAWVHYIGRLTWKLRRTTGQVYSLTDMAVCAMLLESHFKNQEK